uniref:RING-type domain-containing protein n=1 Tax=Amphimedon queenslandica TaxID=400682 RepID=A0A1X7TA93_AMPQE
MAAQLPKWNYGSFLEEAETDGTFRLANSSYCTTFVVQGQSCDVPPLPPPIASTPLTHQSSSSSSSNHGGKRKFGTNSFKPKLSLKGSRAPPGTLKNESWRKNVEICSVSEGKAKKTCNHPVTLTPATACIEAVSNIVSVEAFEGNDVVLLDKDNLRIPDNKTTRSSEYWRAALLVKAVSRKDYRFLSANDQTISDDDDDFVETSFYKPSKKSKSDLSPGPSSSSCPIVLPPGIPSDLEKRISSLESLIKVKKEGGQEYKKIVDVVCANLLCLICKERISIDCVIMTCCKTLGCCQTCFDNWIRESETCPHCRLPVTDETHKKLPYSNQFKLIIEAMGNINSSSSNEVIELN